MEPPRLDDAVAWAERRAASAEPLAQLTAAVQIANELHEVSEELVGHFVSRARDANLSWAAIGSAFGVSRQAAQQRFTAPAERPAPWPEHFDQDAQAAIGLAADEMRGFRHNYLGTEHVLLGLVRQESLAATALRRLGLSEQSIRDAIVEIIGYGETPTSACHGIAPRVKRSLERARREARHAGHRAHARSEHLLLAIAASGGVATQILARHGIDEATLRDQLARLLPDAPEIARALRQGPRRRSRLRRR
jgi:hypothetical protein